jgi:predicted amidohydrolase
MTTFRIALANLAYPASPEDAIARVEAAIARAAAEQARLVCFPECYLPGYRGLGYAPPPPDAAFLERAWAAVARAAKQHAIAVVVGTERIVEGALHISALVVDRQGTRLGFQDKVQLDPSEDGIYVPATTGRRVFETDGVTFGVVICHEGWRYPETVRWAARHGAQLVLHPHLSVPEPGAFVPTGFADPANSFHEKAALCRAAENSCWFATVNYAVAGSPTTSAVARPDGTLLSHQPYGADGLLIADLDLAAATRLLARRYRDVGP